MHTSDISSTTYLPRLVNVVCERPLKPYDQKRDRLVQFKKLKKSLYHNFIEKFDRSI